MKEGFLAFSALITSKEIHPDWFGLIVLITLFDIGGWGRKEGGEEIAFILKAILLHFSHIHYLDTLVIDSWSCR